ncbi:uncharacterized protein TNCV_2061091 [Trichonephila clavipes]|nr:uncharacterized protein TNCV_2061091 [Trichonephila clavipes]
MAYLAKGRRQDLLELAETLDISIPDNFKFLDIKDAILKSEGYDVDFTKECLNRIISDRKELELRAERDKENQRIFELQKLQFTTADSALVSSADSNMPKLELHKLLPIFDPKTTDVTLFLDLFERQLTFLKVPVPQWVVYLVGLVTSLLRTSTAVGIFVGPDTHMCILQLQRNPFLTPEESNTVDQKRREERCFEITRERWPTNPPLTKYWTLTIFN